jgi:hypothetical protein
LYKGNSLMRQSPILDKDHPNLFFMGLINALVDRVFTDVYLGSGAPNASLGEENDIYINLAALTYYTKTEAGWGASTAIDNNANAVLLISSKR